MLLIGCRPGGALGLTWDNVDLDAGTVRIVQALKVEGGSRIVLGSLKTAGSRRTVALPSLLAESLRQHRRRQLEERMKAGPAWYDSGLVFTTQIGTPIHPRNCRRSFDRLIERAGLGKWSPNELRHSAVSLLSAGG
jgi:integrase